MLEFVKKYLRKSFGFRTYDECAEVYCNIYACEKTVITCIDGIMQYQHSKGDPVIENLYRDYACKCLREAKESAQRLMEES